MEFLRKTPQLEWRAFWMVVLLASYGAAATTVLAMYGQLEAAGFKIGLLLLTALTLMTFAFGFSRLVRRTDIVDVMWGIVIAAVGVASLIASPNGVGLGFNVQTLATLLVVVWGARLSYHIVRRLIKRPEDARYVALRKQWRGNEALNTYLRVFVVQAALATVVCAAVICINQADEIAIGAVAWFGTAVWVSGFLFESIGDWQLKRFTAQAKNKGKLMTKGLWRYTRHPNYFGEAAQWWGIFIIALSVPAGWMGVVSPIVITYLLLYVSGVPMAEKALSKKPGWKVYKKRTSLFVPLPPQSD